MVSAPATSVVGCAAGGVLPACWRKRQRARLQGGQTMPQLAKERAQGVCLLTALSVVGSRKVGPSHLLSRVSS